MVLAVLVGVAAPSFVDMFNRNRLTNMSNNLVVSLNAARQVAISRGVTTFLCHTVTADKENPSCGGQDSAWDQGVLIYSSSAFRFNTGLRDFDASGSNPDSLVRQEAFSGQGNIEVTDTNATDHIAFTASGLLLGDNDVTLKVCDSSTPSRQGLLIRVSTSGRIISESTPETGGEACA